MAIRVCGCRIYRALMVEMASAVAQARRTIAAVGLVRQNRGFAMRIVPLLPVTVLGLLAVGIGCGFGAAPGANVVVGLETGVASVAAGGMGHTCALTEQGSVKCWGPNYRGELGDGTTEYRAAPVDVVGLNEKVVAIAAGGTASCAITELGGVKCWGGWDSRNASSEAVDVPDLTGVEAISVGNHQACAVVDGGVVKCWGGEDGIRQPAEVEGVTDAVGVATGGFHSCAALEDGGVKCWGVNNVGQLGTDWFPLNKGPLAPAQEARRVSGVVEIAAGHIYTCALLADGTVTCWGSSPGRRYPEGTTINRDAGQPQEVSGLGTGAKMITAGSFHACVLTDRGVECWDVNPPVVVGLKDAKSISAGFNHTCAVTAEGGVMCWRNL